MATPGMDNKGAGGLSELKQRLWFVFGALNSCPFRIICANPWY